MSGSGGASGAGRSRSTTEGAGITITPQRYKAIVKSKSAKRSLARDVLVAYVVGGALCSAGQLVLNLFQGAGMSRDQAVAPTLATMILIGAVTTGLGVYDTLGEFAGAGAAVPITGFSNTVVSAAMEFRRDGLVAGMASKMFVIAGPVLVFGLVAGITAVALRIVFLGIAGG